MVKLDGISKTFKTDIFTEPFQALDNVSFEIPKGSLVGFLGANGSGKTTSLKIIMDFISADSGSVSFDDSMGRNKMEVFQRMGFLPERPYFYPGLTGLEFLHFLGKVSGTSRSVLVSSIEEWSTRFNIKHALNRQLKTYSKGMLQRIGFLSSIMHNPEFIILDEPLSGLDPVGRRELKNVIVDLLAKGKTIFFSSHVVSDIEEICDRVIFLEKGKLVYDGPVQSLIHNASGSIFSIKVEGDQKIIESCLGLVPNISMIDLGSGFYIIKVPTEQKTLVMKNLMDRMINIVGLDFDKPSLEEIFYRIKEKK